MLLEELVARLNFDVDQSTLNTAIKKFERLELLKKELARRKELNISTLAVEKGINRISYEFSRLEAQLRQHEEYLKLRAIIKQAQEASTAIDRTRTTLERFHIQNPEGRRWSDSQIAAINSGFGKMRESARYTGNFVFNFLKSRLGALAVFAGISFSIKNYIAMTDQLKTLEGQIKNVTKGSKETEKVQRELYAMAGRTRQSYSETAGLFTSVSRNASELGKGQDEILKFTEDVSNAMLLGGGSAASQQAALVQLGQALGSGVLRGDELNSIMEQAPRLAQVIAKGMGTTIGNLRKLGSEGKITAQKVFEAVRSQSEALKGELGKMPWTVQQGNMRVSDATAQVFYAFDKKFKIGEKIAQSLAKTAAWLDKLKEKIDAIDLEDLKQSMKTATIITLAFAIVLKRAFLSSSIHQGIAVLIKLYNMLGIASLKAGLKAAAGWIAGALPLAAVIAGIILLILLIEDLYVWINGGDSVMGRMFGTWGDFVEGMKKKWKELCKACAEWIRKGFIECLKDVFNWIVKILQVMSPLYWMYKGITYLVGDGFNGPLIDTTGWDKPLIDRIRNVNWDKDVLHDGPGVVATDYSGALGRFSGVNTANQTNNNTVNIYGGTPDEVAQKVTDSVFNPPFIATPFESERN